MISHFIPIPLPTPMFHTFFCSYIIEGPPSCLVDVGPYSSHPELLKRLKDLGISSLDYVLLTHIHIDHAGALNPILETYPMAKAVVHEMGLRFLPSPDSFWEASLKVLKERAIEYGKPEPVPLNRLVSHKEAFIPGITIIPTPGHAPHHISFVTANEIFAGEAAGNHFLIEGEHYLRPATPHRFFLNQAIESVDKLIETKVEIVCYAHCGKATDGQRLLKDFRAQLIEWREWIDELLQKNYTVEDIVDELLVRDKRLKQFENLNIHEQNREREFLTNSVLGFKGFLEDKK